jgi:hypothetical protein
LFLSEIVYLLLDSDRLILLGFSFIFFCFVPILDFNLVGLSFALVGMRWQRWWWGVCVEVLIASADLGGAGSSAILAGSCCSGGYVELL